MAADRRNSRLSAEPPSGETYRASVHDEDSERPPMAPFDPLLIEQVLMNLLENAVRYTPAGTVIELSASVEDDELLVELADYGPGLLRGTKSGYSRSSFAVPRQPEESGWD